MDHLSTKQHEIARWAVILAGGDGTRLRPLTRKISGDERPKQFCPILGRETLLERTRRRVALKVSPATTLFVVTRTHEAFYASLLSDAPSQRVVVQPGNLGTAPAILYSLLRIAALAPASSVAFFPSDHYVSDDRVFMAHVEAAFEAVKERPDLVILLGISPYSPEVEYGWIEPSDPVPIPGSSTVFRVRRFWEKPVYAQAQMLLAHGCLWNSFVMVSYVPSLLALIRTTMAGLYQAFCSLKPTLYTPREVRAIGKLYSQLPPSNFSHQVLATRPAHLAVLPVKGVE